MNQLAMSFTDTRARAADPITSKQAAKTASSPHNASLRVLIHRSLVVHGPQTAREISDCEGLEYFDVQRRISEVSGIVKTTATRAGGMLWRVADGCYFAEQGDAARRAST